MDFEDGRRQDVIDYVVNKYGRDHVAQIVTFGTLAARAAIRDCGRAMNKMPMRRDRQALQDDPDHPRRHEDRQGAGSQPGVQGRRTTAAARSRELIDTALRLEGLTRHDSVHAAGVVIAADPLWENVPVQKADDGVGLVTRLPGRRPGKDRPAQDGLPGPGEPDHPGPRRPQRQAQPRRRHRRPETAPGRPQDL